MSLSPYSSIQNKTTPQTQPIFGQEPRQTPNNAGGYVYAVGDLSQLQRFLILGSESGTYYVGEAKLTKENATNAMASIDKHGRAAVDLIVGISEAGRAPKNDPAIFCLALACACKDPDTRAYALSKLGAVCRIPTHWFHFLAFSDGLRGWGQGFKKAVAGLYSGRSVNDLAYLMVKYQSRDGWSHRDVLRLTHPKVGDEILHEGSPASRNALYKWAVDGFDSIPYDGWGQMPQLVWAFEQAKRYGLENNGDTLVRLIHDFGLTREMVPTEALAVPKVWEALLIKMKPEAMIRNLATMTRVGLLAPFAEANRTVIERLYDKEALAKARIHPVNVLMALKTYASGHGLRGRGEPWTPIPQIVDALNDCFYLCFNSLAPTGKRFLFGLDVSGSMSSPCGGTPMHCNEGATAMALAVAHVESNYHIMAFDHGIRPLPITAGMRLDTAMQYTRNINGGGTNCALPMEFALEKRIPVDCFVVITDNETHNGSQHASQALKKYRDGMGIHAKEVVIGMTATKFSVASPDDPDTLDIVGFDSSVPQLVQEFAR